MRNLFLLGALLFALPANAGAKYESAACVRNLDGSGSCHGTLRGFRNSTDPNAYVNFAYYSNQTPGFNAEWAGQASVCTVVAGSKLEQIWPVAMANSGYFNINWNSSGQCTYLVIDSGSAYTDY